MPTNNFQDWVQAEQTVDTDASRQGTNTSRMTGIAKNNQSDTERQEMICSQPLTPENSYILNTQVSATRPATDYTARFIPHYNGVAIPLEATQILWQR